MPSKRSVTIVGNWKMYKTNTEAVAYIQDLASKIADTTHNVYLAVPFTAIQPSSEAAKGSRIEIGGQNMNDASEGAFTGEIAAKMLIDAGAKFVILGHSERRRYFGETNDFIQRKVLAALSDGIQPILCIGESSKDRDQNKTKEIIREQLNGCLSHLPANKIQHLIIAYEPLWAIGTGNHATPEQADEVHASIRDLFKENWGKEAAENLTILYGGSVNPENAPTFMERLHIDGLLVGGASLDLNTFDQIINFEKYKIQQV
jgi:triosephosphate isomerase